MTSPPFFSIVAMGGLLGGLIVLLLLAVGGSGLLLPGVGLDRWLRLGERDDSSGGGEGGARWWAWCSRLRLWRDWRSSCRRSCSSGWSVMASGRVVVIFGGFMGRFFRVRKVGGKSGRERRMVGGWLFGGLFVRVEVVGVGSAVELAAESADWVAVIGLSSRC